MLERIDKQRVLLATSTYFPAVGGQELVVEKLVSNFVKQGQYVVLMVPFRSWMHMLARRQRPYSIVPALPLQATFLRRKSKVFNALWHLYTRLIVAIFRINLISSHGFFPTGVLFASVAKQINCFHVACCHGADIQVDKSSSYGVRLDPVVDRIVRDAVAQVDHFVAISQSVRDEYIALGIDEGQISSIPNGFGDERFVDAESAAARQEIRQRFNLKTSDFVILTVGRNHPKKNFKEVIKVAELLYDKAPDIKFVVCGSDVSGLGDVPKNVMLLDPIVEQWGRRRIPDDNIIALYQSSDVFFFPSFVETFGIVLAEAMSFGLPIVCSDISACAEVIGHGKYGLNCAPDDSVAFARHIESLYLSERYRKSFAAKSRKRSLDFTWNAVVARYLDLFRHSI